MWNFLLRNRRWPIGLDIGRDSIKMLQLRKVGQTLCISACARWEFPDVTEEHQLALESVYGDLPSLVAFPRTALGHLPDSEADLVADADRRRRLWAAVRDAFAAMEQAND